jgi:hypothetical protein
MTDWTWPSSRNNISREDLRIALSQYSRDPFGDVLEALLQARPSTEQLLKWAASDPAQWANAIKIFSLLNGYTEKTESTTIHKHLHLHKLSDAELLQEAQAMIQRDPGLLQELKTIHDSDISQKQQIESVKMNPFLIDDSST